MTLPSWKVESVGKAYTDECYHYFLDGKYVGAVWKDAEDKTWSAHCTAAKKYGHLGDFPSREEAEVELAAKLA